MRLPNEKLQETTDVHIVFNKKGSKNFIVRRNFGEVNDEEIHDLFRKYLHESVGRVGYSCVGLDNGEYVVFYTINREMLVSYGKINKVLNEIKESMTLQLVNEKIERAEQESNDIEKIEQEKRQFEALQDWSKKPRYKMPEDSPTVIERIKKWFRDLIILNEYCEKHNKEFVEHGFNGMKDCPDCRFEEIRDYVRRR